MDIVIEIRGKQYLIVSGPKKGKYKLKDLSNGVIVSAGYLMVNEALDKKEAYCG